MQFSISEFFLTKFSIGRSGASLTKDFRGRLGLATNYEVARLAIGLSMTQGTYPKSTSGSALSIWSGTLFDHDDYSLWIGLLITNYVQFHPEKAGNISVELLQEIVQAHWDNGLIIMQDIWEKSDGDSNRFWQMLLHSYADIPDEVAPVIDPAPDSSPSFAAGAVRLVLGRVLRKNGETGDDFVHEVNGAGYAPHIAIMGQAGSGKTRVMTHILQQMKKQAQCPVILVDLGKGDLGRNKYLIQSLGATVLSVPEQPIPLDMFHVADMSDTNLTTAAMENFRDAFAQVSGKLGPKQSDNIAEALLPLFRSQQRITFQKIKETVDAFYVDNGLSKDSVVSTVNSLTLRELFRPELSPDEFFRKSWVITFANARTEVKTFAVCLFF